MFFYVSLFVACVITTMLVLYLYNALAGAGRAVFKALLPSSKNSSTGHLERARQNSTKNGAQAPWGWKGNNNEVRARGLNGATVNGASGLDTLIGNCDNQSASVGWPYREEKTEVAGTAYKVSRKAGSVRTSGKPWGW